MYKRDIVMTRNLTTTDAVDLDRLARCAPATADLLELAAWLQTHGAAHLRAIERIELAERLTRRRFIIGASGLLGAAALGACGAGIDESGDGAAAQEPTAEQRTITDDLGRSVEAPATPQRIVALHDIQVMRPLLDLGITPIASAAHPAADGAFRFVEDYDVSRVESVGLIGEPNLETLVQLKPDLIIGTLSAQTDIFTDTMSEIAPTIVLDAGKSVIEHHQFLADIVGRLAAYNDLMQEYETRLTRLREQMAPLHDDLVVSILAFNPNAGQIQIAEGPYTLIFAGAGIRQPDPQVNFESTDPG
ncbi:MAG: ABC transporter substrate-binding protein, partial [Chloroflexales bacterium]|nr:ABC transporter substrate-binding protein [Chloroflexales bacterium]